MLNYAKAQGWSARRGSEGALEKTQQINLGYALVAFLLLMIFQSWWATQQQIETIPYSDFQALVEQGAIEEL